MIRIPKVIGTINYKGILKDIVNDLERLEELEKENERLKKAIDIFAKLIYLREHNKLKCLYTDECYYELLNEEYELLKEVLENE